jgi:hypothetical protein
MLPLKAQIFTQTHNHRVLSGSHFEWMSKQLPEPRTRDASGTSATPQITTLSRLDRKVAGSRLSPVTIVGAGNWQGFLHRTCHLF